LKKLYQVMAIELENRKEQAPKVQEVFTKYGDCILARQGVQDIERKRGIITLNVRATDDYLEEFSRELTDIPGVNVQRVKFED
jgi:tRNA threonylcarbamoyladenosine modification (KEOPS) complex  Pcc1 subunit